MDLLNTLIAAFSHPEQYLSLLNHLGIWLYLLLFAVVFLETGLIILSAVPADSLLFAAGALAALGSLELHWLILLMCLATALGDSINYLIGQHAGRRLLLNRLPFNSAKHLAQTERFVLQHGHKAIFVSRFIPVVRPLAPVVAGIALMPYQRFLAYNIMGGLVWVGVFVFAGFYFGNMALVREHLSLVLVSVVLISLLPAVITLGHRRFSAGK